MMGVALGTLGGPPLGGLMCASSLRCPGRRTAPHLQQDAPAPAPGLTPTLHCDGPLVPPLEAPPPVRTRVPLNTLKVPFVSVCCLHGIGASAPSQIVHRGPTP